MAIRPPEGLPDACQVAIIGGGPAGCACALTLAEAGIDDVVLIEAGDYSRQRVGESLPPDARLLLKLLGVWRDFLDQGHDPCLGSCSAWGGAALGYNDFVTNPMGPGWHLDRQRFDGLLADAVRDCGMPLLTNTRFTGVAADADGWVLHVRDSDGASRRLTARFVVDATGLHSRVARAMGARRRLLDRLFCVYGFFLRPEEEPANRLTMLEAVEDGWWYKASLPDGKLCIALACDEDSLRRQRLNQWQRWLNSLAATRHVARDLSGHRFLKDEMLVTPAPSYVLDVCCGRQWLATGDAACSFDPLMSRGIHKALEDGIHAGRVVARWVRSGADEADDYRQSIEQRYGTFVSMRQYFYAQETRWPRSAFWQRRRAA